MPETPPPPPPPGQQPYGYLPPPPPLPPGQQPYGHYPPPWPPRPRRPVLPIGIAGGSLIAVGLLLRIIPVKGYGSIPQWDRLCSSGIGQIGQALSATAARDCNWVSAANVVTWLMLIAGTVLTIIAIAMSLSAASQR